MKVSFFPTLLFILVFFSCKKDNEVPSNNPIDELNPFIVYEPLFGCSNYQTFDIASEGHFNHILKFNDYFIFGASDHLVVKSDLDENILLDEEIWVNQLIEKDNHLIICGQDGIHKMDNNLNLELIDETTCNDMIITSDGNLVGVSIQYNYVFEINLNLNTITPYTSPHNASTNGMSCQSLKEVIEYEDELWARTCFNEIARFKNGEYIGLFNSENSPFKNTSNDNFYMISFEEDIIVVEDVDHQIVKYTNGEWIVLKDFEEGTSDKDRYMRVASIQQPFIFNDFLYVPTTLSGCRGVQKFDITKNETLLDSDYDVVHDEELPFQCVTNIYQPEGEKDIYVISAQKKITKMDCL